MIDDIFLFIRVAQAGSFTDAARIYKIHPTTISRRLKAIEIALNIKLFNLNRMNQIELTNDGESLKNQFWEIFLQSEEIIADIKNPNDISGSITLVLSDAMRYYLNDALYEILAKYPKLKINIYSSYFTQIGHEINFDIGLTPAVPLQANYVRQKLLTFEAKLFASQKYIDKYGLPQSITELPGQHKIIGLINLADNAIITDFTLHGESGNLHQITLNSQNVNLSSDSFDMAISLAKLGVGIVAALPKLVEGHNLIPILPSYTATAQVNIFLVQSNNTLTKAKELILDVIKTRLGV